MRTLKSLLLGTAVAIAAPLAASFVAPAVAATAPAYQHVLLISVDGMHAGDLNYLLNQPGDTWFKRLAHHATVFPNTASSAPSDSFPGMIALVTGASPKTSDVFYDDSFDRTYFAAGSNCIGKPGVETNWSEALDRKQDAITGGGILGQPLTQIDPAKLPLRLVNGVCVKVLPHEFNHANTVFEVIKAAGMRTAWSDKHPAYEILNGPSGQGIDDLYTPEVNSLIPGQTHDNTKSFKYITIYDGFKVRAVINQIKGMDSTGTKTVGVPAILGMNFQTVSVGQKLATSGYGDAPGLIGGYADANGTPGNALTAQFQYVDHSIGLMVQALQQQGLYDKTLIIITAKHGQSPIDVSTRVAVDDAPYTMTPGYAFHVADDVGLLWLDPNVRTPAILDQAAAYLEENKVRLHIKTVLDARSLASIYANPLYDAHTPDFVTIVDHGVIYTGGSKLSEHGGFAFDDRNVAMMVASPKLPSSVDYSYVETKQIAPTILAALGLDPTKLDGVKKEGTTKLPY